MLNAMIAWSLRHRFIVVALTALLVVTGAFSAFHLPIDAFPDVTPVQVQINTVAPALTPVEIEQQITFPVEQAISGLKGLTEVRSLSKFGLSQVTVIFEDGVDIYFARQLVMERLGSVDLPEGFPAPEMGPVATGLGEVFHYVLTSPTRGLSELRTIQDWIIKPQLRSVSGVAEVNSWGGRERQYQVVVDPPRLLKYDLTLFDIFDALRRNNLNVGGGTITRAGESLLVQGVGLLESLDQVRNVIIKSEDGVPIYIHQIGDVVDGYEIRRGAVTYAGQGEAVLGLGFMLMGENPRDVTERMKERMETIRPSLPDDVEVTTVYDRTELVDHVLHTVETNLSEGALLVIVVLFILLYKFGDAFAGVMANPFYIEMQFTKIEIANVSKVFGLAATLVGVFVGGALVYRLGTVRALLLAGILQAASNLMFALQAYVGHDLGLLALTIAVENVTGGMGSAAFVAYLSSLTSVAYTATQYALLSSFMAIGRTVLAASSGWLADHVDWVSFFLISTVIALPGLILLWWMMRRYPARA